MKTTTQTILKAFALSLGLSMVAALVGCSSSTSPSPTIAVAVASGNNQAATVGTAFGAALSVMVTSNGSPASGVSVTFTAPSTEPDGSFATGGATDTETTNSSGVATTSQAFTAGTTAGSYSITASATGGSSNATFTLTNTAGTPTTLTAASGASQYVTISTSPAGALIANVTDTDGNPVQGVSVTFTAPSTGASGTFTSTGNNVETDQTDQNGNATASDFVANATVGAYNVVASSTGLSPVDFALTNAVAPVADGNYVFYLNGTDSFDGSTYIVAGAFTVTGGAIVNGEQDFEDFNEALVQDSINPVGSSITATADANFEIILTTCLGSDCTQTDGGLGVGGVETINGALFPLNTSKGYISEFDTSATSSGEFDLQDPTAAAATPSMGYAFGVGGVDINDAPLVIGGVINVDGTGTISGTGSIFDANDNFSGATFQGETLGASTVSAPDSFGRVLFTLNPTDATDFPQILLVGYIVDSSTIRLVESADIYSATLGGAARSQGANTGTFSATSINGASYVASMYGTDANGTLQTAGVLSFSSAGTLSGFVDFNDLTGSEPVSPDPVTAPAFTVDPTGRVTVAGVTDSAAVANFNLQMYLDGNGNAYILTMDSTDAVVGFSSLQTSSSLTDGDFKHVYAMDTGGLDGMESGQFSTVGQVKANGTGDTISSNASFADYNWLYEFNGTDEPFGGTYVLSTPGILSGSITGLDFDSSFANPDAVDIYLIDTDGDSVLIETDTNQLMLGAISKQ
jgi:hypothetical protein